MTTPGRHQRITIYEDPRTGIVEGRFYLDKPYPVRRKLFRFADVGLRAERGADGAWTIVREGGARAEASRWKDYARRYAEIERALAVSVSQAERRGVRPVKVRFQAWKEAAKGLRRRPRSLARYESVSALYLKACGNHPFPENAAETRKRGLAFLAWLEKNPPKGRALSPATIRGYMGTIRHFWGWAADEGLLGSVPRLRLPTAPVKLRQGHTDSLIAGLFALIAAQRLYYTPGTRRHRQALLCERFALLDLGTGLRRGEIQSRKWDRFDFAGARVRIDSEPDADFTVKGNRERWHPITPGAAAVLEQIRKASPDEVWFLDNGHGALGFTRDGLSHAFGRFLGKLAAAGHATAGIKPTHGLRAYYLQGLFDQGTDPETVRVAVGHQSIDVTLGYLTNPGVHVKDAVRRHGARVDRLLTRAGLRVVDGGG